MKKVILKIFALSILVLSALPFLHAQNAPVVVEVENGAVGSDFAVAPTGDGAYITITTDGSLNIPENAARIVTLEVTFPAAQAYDLYVRLRVGPGAANDDSFFYGNGFGEKFPTSPDDWVRANNLHAVGYAGPGQVVDGAGATSTGVWKWINLSEFTMDEPPVVFDVPAGALTQTFQIGARENGLDIDKVAFARADYYYTVSNLDNGEPGSDTPGGDPSTPPIADGKPKFLGSVYSQSQKVGFTNYFNQVTPENAGKWGSVEFSRDNMNWTQLDSAYALAKDNGFPYRHHVLIWGNQQPSWIENLPVNEQREEIEEWFEAVAGRYPDIDFVEVVNEPLHDPPNSPGQGGGNYIEALGGSGSTGWDWILEAFRLARQYFPNSELLINDYNIVNSASNVSEYLEIIELLQAEGLIDQIGVQAHAFSTGGSASQMRNNLDALAATGLPIYVTELDIDGPADQVQLSSYQRIFPVFWEHPAVKGVTLWGYRPGMWRTEQMAYLIAQDGVTERPALIWLRDYIQSTVLSTHEPAPSADHIRVFPNPLTSNQITVQGMEKVQRADLFGLNGQLVWSGNPASNSFRIDATLAPGLHILLLYDERYVYAKKVLVKGQGE